MMSATSVVTQAATISIRYSSYYSELKNEAKLKYEAKLKIFSATIDTDFVDNAIKEVEPFIKLAILP